MADGDLEGQHRHFGCWSWNAETGMLLMRVRIEDPWCEGMMNIDSIIWPADAKAACNHYLKFVIQVVETLGIIFPNTRPDPRAVAERYIDGEISDEEYGAEACAWWELLEAAGEIRISRERSLLLVRLALCLLSATPDEAPRLGDHLSWFLEMLYFMGIDSREPHAMMSKYFAWRGPADG